MYRRTAIRVASHLAHSWSWSSGEWCLGGASQLEADLTRNYCYYCHH